MKIWNKLFGRKNMAGSDPKNYTDEMVARMEEVYSANPTRATAETLAVEFDKPVRSIIAKLSNMGIYKAQARTTKSGAPVVRKEELVAQIQASLGTQQLASLSKATKADLKTLAVLVAN